VHATTVKADLEHYTGPDGSCQVGGGDYVKCMPGARNGVLLPFLLRFFVLSLSGEQCMGLAPLLRNPDPEVRYLVVRQFSLITHDEDHSVDEYRIEGGRMIRYPNLDLQVAYWMRRYGMVPP
jgi:hypothetical protein